MADEIDIANDRAEIERAAALYRHASRNRRHGLSRCSICDEPISEFRQALGAIHCLDHAAELEQRRGLR